MKSGQDHTLEVTPEELKQASYLSYTANLEELKDCNFYIVTVPTPIDDFKQPDLTPLIKASTSIGQVLKKEILLFMNLLCTQVQQKRYVFLF